MNAKYPHYRDILGPVELSLRGIQYGIGLISSASTGASVGEAEPLVTGLLSVPNAGASFIDDSSLDDVLRIVHHSDDESSGGPRTTSTGRGALDDKLRLLALRIDAVRLGVEHATSFEQREALQNEFDRVAREVHAIWTETVEQEKARLAEEEALFKVKARALTSEDDIEFQRELSRMFPQASDRLWKRFQQEDEDGGDGDNGGEDAATSRITIERKRVTAMVLDAVYDAFAALNGDGGTTVTKSSASASASASSASSASSAASASVSSVRFSMGVDMVSRLRGGLSSALDNVSVPGFTFVLGREWQALTARPDGEADRVDMYERNIEEASRIQKPVERIMERLDQLLDEWPDHPILDQLRKIGARLLDMPLDSPLKSYATGIELLLNKAQVWEETAAKHVTLDELLKPLVAIAAHWRKLELNAWKDMLLKARREGEEEAREAWFFLFGIIHTELRYGSGNGTAELMELVNALDAFVQGSPVGQYEERLALLTMFSRSCRQRRQRGYDEVSKALGNLARYYGQFQPAIDDRVAADLKPLEKELADFVKLAKWEDRGFYAMKASAEKAHSQLCKIIRKAKDALGTPASTCLRVLAGDIGIDAADKDKDIASKTKSKDKDKDKEKHGSAKATHGTTSKTMQLLASLRGTPPVSVDVPPSTPSSVHLRPAESNLLVGIVDVVLLTWRRSEPTTLTRGDPPSLGLSASRPLGLSVSRSLTRATRHALRSFARSPGQILQARPRHRWNVPEDGQEQGGRHRGDLRRGIPGRRPVDGRARAGHRAQERRLKGRQVEKEEGFDGLFQGAGGLRHQQAADGGRHQRQGPPPVDDGRLRGRLGFELLLRVDRAPQQAARGVAAAAPGRPGPGDPHGEQHDDARRPSRPGNQVGIHLRAGSEATPSGFDWVV